MLERRVFGEVPSKHHIALRGPDGALRHEECVTRDGFEGPYTILYHEQRPHAARPISAPGGWRLPESVGKQRLAKRHYRSFELAKAPGSPIAARVPLLFNRDVTLSVVKPSASDTVYFADGDADQLIFVFEGAGELISQYGRLPFKKNDYLFIPRSTIHRFELAPGAEQYWLSFELHGGLHLPRQWRNEVGQLRMDAPYCHRDFKLPAFQGPVDEGIRELLVKRGAAFHGFGYEQSPLDVVGWDGAVYPWVFPILSFQPRVSSVHLPPTWHGTFAARGALVCSFVPRLVDFHPEAIPCPYPHSSVDMDEFLFYCDGNFTSRRGILPGSISHHPAGLPHGPHPGAYEASLGTKETNELAVMLDVYEPLEPTAAALALEDTEYSESFF